VGRHLRPRPHFKLIVGREEGENHFLEGYRKQFTHLKPVTHSGPLALLDGEADDNDLMLAARLVARFSQGRDAEEVGVEIVERGARSRVIRVAPLPSAAVRDEWYL